MVSKKDRQGDNNYISLFKTKILKDTANWDNKEQKEGKNGRHITGDKVPENNLSSAWHLPHTSHDTSLILLVEKLMDVLKPLMILLNDTRHNTENFRRQEHSTQQRPSPKQI